MLLTFVVCVLVLAALAAIERQWPLACVYAGVLALTGAGELWSLAATGVTMSHNWWVIHGEHPWWAVLSDGALIVGALALAGHFWFGRKERKQ